MEGTQKIITYGDPNARGIIECPYCTAPLDAPVEGTARCKSCGNLWTVPKRDTAPQALYYLRMGDHDRDTGKFNDAFEAYRRAAELDPQEPEAYFGMALAQFKVQYIKDLVNKRVQPICHEISAKNFSADKNYLHTLELATKEQKRLYREKAAEIDEIRDQFNEFKKDVKNRYDCFLCVKVSNENGDTTQDSHEALKLYNHLKSKGFHPFYSEAEIGNRTGSDYEALILYALYSSECMLIICSDENYLQTPWVKNEYTRFMAMLANEEKERDAITFVFRGKPIERLPGKNGKIQGIDLSHSDAYLKIDEYVESHTPEAKARRAKEAKLKEINRSEQEKRVAQIEEEIKRVTEGTRSTIGTKLTRAWQEMDARNFTSADNYFQSVIESDPTNEEAWRGKFLAEFSTTTEEALISKITIEKVDSIIHSNSLKNYLKYKKSNQYNKVYLKLKQTVETLLRKQIESCNKEIKKNKASITRRNFLKFILPILIGGGIFALSYFLITPAILNAIGVSGSDMLPTIILCGVISVIATVITIVIVLDKLNNTYKKNKTKEMQNVLKGFNKLYNEQASVLIINNPNKRNAA